MTAMRRLLITCAAILTAGADVSMGSGRANADPVWHQVVYIVSARNPAYVDIFYQDQDPTLFRSRLRPTVSSWCS